MINLAALSDAVYARVASDAAGADLRARLGAGAASVLSAEELRLRTDAGTQRLPALPLLALRRGAAPTIERGLATLPRYTWYALGDPAVGYGALDALAAPIGALYADWLALGVYSVEIAAGPHDRDRTLGLLLVTYELDIGSI